MTSFKVICCLCLTWLAACNTKKVAQMSFEQDTLRFAALPKQEFLANFTFVNSGSDTLIIQSVDADCGCLSVEYPKMPLPPGKQGTVKVKYSTGEKSGSVTRLVVLEANTNPTLHTLVLMGRVKPSP
jgi:hypothetical protein